MSEHYKSLITDDEVIRELMKESKRREGKLPTETMRLKPNLNFFQRTVSSLVSNNTRIDKSKDTFKTDYIKDCNIEKLERSNCSPEHPSKKSNIDYVFERDMVLKTKINFVKSSERFSSSVGSRTKNKIEIKKINFVRGAANASYRGSNCNNTKTDNKLNNAKQKPGTISSGSLSDSKDSESSTSQSSLDEILTPNNKRKTNCRNISTKQDKTGTKSKRKKLNKNDVICISSDDSSIEIVPSCLEDKNIKSKVKTQNKKRKKKVNNSSDEEYKRKTKRKKNKKKKNQKIDKG